MTNPHLKPFGNTLIIGVGPAGIHAAVDWSKQSNQVGLLNRKGTRADQIQQELEHNHYAIYADLQTPQARHLSGGTIVSRFYNGYADVEDIWHTLVLCTPSDSYTRVIQQLDLEAMKQLRTIVLISPGIGSNLLLQSTLGHFAASIELISFSTYYASSRFPSHENTMLKTVVKGMKRKIFVASNRKDSKVTQTIKALLEAQTIQCELAASPIEAESRSITTYVHPPFFINDYSLNEIFGSHISRKYLYKLYPEGPITQHTIRSMILLWKEISQLLLLFGVKPMNLLKFLNDDNYPVHETTLSRADIEGFPQMEPVQQEYMLYIRYSSILIDPFSEPDEQGKYVDFSAIPYKQAEVDENGSWSIPRIPYEDYKRLKLLCSLGQLLGVHMKHSLALVELFERKLSAFIEEKGANRFASDRMTDDTGEQAAMILLIFQEQEGEACLDNT
ncbi:opine metallophore biosynthesis dehydrogenase [Paenibacillus sp. UMB4589-SE434]|uniref:opine metallophore biosynthesis dehydrogenase n=1 Tax=Paenibacillus sp. UMB4589-SE434 TaxID=3046314 RepID=UPI00254EEDFE|nr:opine metallophore biosynthesis dehydrogenase [Paenibacillus sp. UMB4589-SE434]MDK8180233.1 opine metallophore biosynthesis dehydrogenase [Paenibacillus sp. UMB4589-SE434]